MVDNDSGTGVSDAIRTKAAGSNDKGPKAGAAVDAAAVGAGRTASHSPPPSPPLTADALPKEQQTQSGDVEKLSPVSPVLSPTSSSSVSARPIKKPTDTILHIDDDKNSPSSPAAGSGSGSSSSSSSSSSSPAGDGADSAAGAQNGENASSAPSPLHVHHFDTYAFVRELEQHGFTREQSVTLMEAVRGLLQVDLDRAQEEHLSKSDAENVLKQALTLSHSPLSPPLYTPLPPPPPLAPAPLPTFLCVLTRLRAFSALITLFPSFGRG